MTWHVEHANDPSHAPIFPLISTQFPQGLEAGFGTLEVNVVFVGNVEEGIPRTHLKRRLLTIRRNKRHRQSTPSTPNQIQTYSSPGFGASTCLCRQTTSQKVTSPQHTMRARKRPYSRPHTCPSREYSDCVPSRPEEVSGEGPEPSCADAY
jgi:hypothetical protein